jgi:hypothetical protein
MATEWRRSVEFGNKTNCLVRSLSWDEYNHFKQTGELPEPGAMPVKDDIFSFYRGFTPPRRMFRHHERAWPNTHRGRTRLGWPSKPPEPRRRPRLIASK